MSERWDMRGRVCLITGATSGIGLAAAEGLAHLGATTLLVGRHPARLEAARARVGAQGDPSRVHGFLADLSDMTQVRRLAREVLETFPRLHVLVNNAGAFFLRRQESVDGFEMTLAVNHLAPFLLTNLLLDALRAGAPARIVNVASAAHHDGRIHFEDLQLRRGYNGWKAYAQSKLANVLFTYELARRLAGTGVTVNALHPGWVATRIGDNNGLLARLALRIARLTALSPEEGAEGIVYLAASPEVEGVTGRYFVRTREARSSRLSYDEETARRLWDASLALTALEPSR